MFADEAIPYDVASALISHGVLPELNNRQAIRRFTARRNLSYLVGLYCLVSVTLNGFDVQKYQNQMRRERFTSEPSQMPTVFQNFRR
jgi:hypothetical protein